jgi:hypothetical protein
MAVAGGGYPCPPVGAQRVNRSRLRVAPLALVAALVLAGCGDVAEPPAATVNGVRIPERSLLDEVRAIRSDEQLRQRNEADFGMPLAGTATGTFDSTFTSQVLQLQIYFELIEQELDDRDIELTSRALDAARDRVVERAAADGLDLEAVPDDHLDRIVRREALIDAIGPALVGGDAEGFFEENPELFVERCVSHVFVSLEQRTAEAAEARAEELRALIEGGAPFEVVASEQSDDPAAAAQQGELGCGPAGRFIEEFEAAVDELEPEEVSEPVQTPVGFHIIRVDELREPTFEEARDDVTEQLRTRIGPAIQELLVEATTQADVDVNPRFGAWVVDDELGPGFGQVRPPAGPTTPAAAGPEADDG